MPVRNEDWVLGFSARAVLRWCDELVILDHASTDGSSQIASEVTEEHPGRVTVLREDSPVWEECRHRQWLLSTARSRGATHIAMVDADEVLTANLLPSIRRLIERMPSRGIFQLPWVCLARGLQAYYAEGIWFNNWVSCAFVDSPEFHWQARDGYDFHHRHPMGIANPDFCRPVVQSPASAGHGGGLMHLQFVSERRLKAKQYLYQLTERLRWPGREPVSTVRARYCPAVYDSDPRRVATAPVSESWWDGYADTVSELSPERAPWQIGECQRILCEHPQLADGLDNFGGWT
jgi:hypothetical protein